MPRRFHARRVAAFCAAAVLAVTLAACAPEETSTVELPAQADGALPAETQDQLQAAVQHAMAATGSPGAIVGVWAPWGGSWVEGIGTTAPDGAEVSPEMTFGATSVTRAMTCDVLYALVDNGTVALSDSVTDYVTGLPAFEDITLGQLCDSSSGLGGYAGKVNGRLIANPEREWNPRELLAYGMTGDLAFDAGSAFRDSDTGYVLLGLALERAAGAPASDLLAEYVFAPLGLANTSLPAGPGATTLTGLRSGTVDGKVDCAAPVDVSGLSPSAGYTAGGVVSNIYDLGRYTRALATGARDFDDAARFAEPFPTGGSQPSWFTARGGAYQAGTLIGQYGAMPGYMTASFADQNTGMTVAVVLNNSRANAAVARSLAWELAAIASKVPAVAGETAPEAGLPWTAENMVADIDEFAICPTA